MGDSFFYPRTLKRYTPDDSINYVISDEVLRVTEHVLGEYGDIDPSNEGLVYWGGVREQDVTRITLVIAPDTESGFGRVSTSNRSNFDVVRELNKHNVIQVAQVHTHSSGWVDHSYGDDDLAPFKIEGLVSIVVPKYCRDGMLPLTRCGIHRYNNNFIRLSTEYIRNHFNVVKDLKAKFVDLRK